MTGLTFLPTPAVPLAAYTFHHRPPLMHTKHLRGLQHAQSSSSGRNVLHLNMHGDDDEKYWNLNGLGALMPAPREGRYSPNDWLFNMATMFKAPTMKLIKGRLAFQLLISVLVWCLFQRFPATLSWVFEGVSSVSHQLVGFALGLMLVFRTNTAYDRYWEGRKTWGQMVTCCRVLAHMCHRGLDPIARDHFLQILSVFPACFLHHLTLRVAKDDDDKHKAFVRSKLGDEAELVLGTRNGPLMLCKMMMATATHSLNEPDILIRMIQSEKDPTRASVRKLLHQQELKALWAVLDTQNNNLIQCISSAERIVKSTVPVSYSRHMSRFITLWCMTLPVALIKALQWRMIPVTMAICWSLMTIEEVGHIIEDPFNIPKKDNDALGVHRSMWSLEADILEQMLEADMLEQAPYTRHQKDRPDLDIALLTSTPAWMSRVYSFHETYIQRLAADEDEEDDMLEDSHQLFGDVREGSVGPVDKEQASYKGIVPDPLHGANV